MRKLLFPLLLILSLTALYQYKYINEHLSLTHAWAQADHFAITQGFIDNNFNFFKPQTHIYNHQFPNWWEVPGNSTITAVDFPIHNYVVALLMKLTGIKSTIIFRLYVLLYGCIGLLFLYKLSFNYTKSTIKSYLVTLFAATSPVLVYYHSALLPTVPSLANTIIAFYFYLQYRYNKSDRQFGIAILLFTLSSLARTTFAIPLIAVLSVEFLRVIKQETEYSRKLLPIGLSVLIIVTYKLYNTYLTNQYGSDFLSSLMPPKNFAQAKELITEVYKYHRWYYFSKGQYLVFGVIVSLLFVNYWRKKNIQNNNNGLGLLLVAYFIGCILFFIAMMRQFPVHDYYFIDSFYLPLVLLFMVLLSKVYIPVNKVYKQLLLVTAIVTMGISILYPVKWQQDKRLTGSWNKTDITIKNFTGVDIFLDSLNIPSNSKILLLDALAPNLALNLMNRNGYSIMSTKCTNIKNCLSWDYNYIVTQNSYFLSDIYSVYPEILNTIEVVANNGRITVSKYSKNGTLLAEFLGFNKKEIIVSESLNLEESVNSNWQNINIQTIDTIGKIGFISADNEWGTTYKTNDINIFNTTNHTLLFHSQIKADKVDDLLLVLSISDSTTNKYYNTYSLKNYLQSDSNEFSKVNLVFHIPPLNIENPEFAIYLWNRSRINVWYKQFRFDIY